MKQLPIICHESIGPIKLGTSRAEIRSVLEEFGFSLETIRGTLDYFAEASIQVSYSEDQTVRFIGISFHPSYICTYKGTNVFDLPASELFSVVAASEGDTSIHSFNPDGYVFPVQILSLWDADSQYDRLGGEIRPIWAQVGIGDARYLAAIEK